ncbi:MAG TPA: T9SS type A sorting domain-containing protein, partial [Rhodothermales bacterium]|nr:T9SS type A sorting domain-containing protein [Rhodothermales bacterium]
DGTTAYSPTVEVTVGLDDASLVEVRGQSVRFAVRETQPVRAELYNALGQRVSTLFEGEAQAGQTQLLDVPAGLSSGVYLVRLSGRSIAETARVVVR